MKQFAISLNFASMIVFGLCLGYIAALANADGVSTGVFYVQ